MKYDEAHELVHQAPQAVIRVSCLYHAVERAQHLKAELVISLLERDYQHLLPDFKNETLLDHHVYWMGDSIDGMRPGMQETVSDLIRIGQSWKEKNEVPRTLVHCYGGVARSTAATYILLSAAFPDISAAKLFKIVTENLTRKASPNIMMIKIADGMLERDKVLQEPVVEYLEHFPNLREAHKRHQRMGRRIGIGLQHKQHL